MSVTYTVDPEQGVAELAIVPGVSTRATRRQWEETERTIEAWTAEIAEYLEAAGSLYAYLDDHPDRARACLGALLADRLSEEEAKALEPLAPEEAELVEHLDEAMGAVLGVLAVPSGGAYSPDEISHLVYDPFPARLTVKLPGKPLEIEGFLRDKDGVFTVPSPGLWEALRSLEGRWISPDPALSFVEKEFDFGAFLGKPRQAAPKHRLPSAEEVRSAIEARLKPAPLYRAAWKVQPEDETKFQWEEEP